MRESFRRFGRIILPVAVSLIFFLALYFLFRALRGIHYRDLAAVLKGYPAASLALALAATIANYAILTLYDALALRYVGRSLPYRKTAFVSFLSYVFSNNVGLSIFGAGAVRLRFYPQWGVEIATVARIVGFCALTFWLGLAAMGGLSLLTSPPVGASGTLALAYRIGGGLLICAVLLYLATAARGRAEIHVGKLVVKLPGARIAIAQLVVASLDWVLAAFVLYTFLPAGKPSFAVVLPAFMASQLAGSASHVPGGIGVFESVAILSLSSFIPAKELVGALLAYRFCYYLMPLAVAIVAFIAKEVLSARTRLAGVAAEASRAFTGFVPAVLAAAAFIAGLVLLVSGVLPGSGWRLDFLGSIVPLPVLEISHFAASLVGLGLVIVADALRRRVGAAYWLTLALLAGGIVFSLLKGLDWEEALVLAVVALLILPSRRFFHRRASVFALNTSPLQFAAFGIAIVGSLWIGLFVHKHVSYSTELFWQFEISKEAPRALRASLGVVLAAVAFAIRSLLKPAPRIARETLMDREADVHRALALSSQASSNLALLGDKYFIFDPEARAFIMYAVAGSTFVVMGDPVGEESRFQGLLWDFHEHVRHEGGRTVWYEISSRYLSSYLELGQRLFKFGEEAMVDLDAFSLAGGRGKRLRPPCNKLEREGYGFRVLEAGEFAARAGEFRAISDEWLHAKKAKEKGFSLGFFDETYLKDFRMAVVEREGRLTAFANLWSSGNGEELAVDIMRHEAGAPNGTMEYLFVGAMQWGRQSGYRRFSLGMAPLSGMEARESAPIWNKAASLIFRNAEGIYNFQGLRAFKEKFSPAWSPRYIVIPTGASLATVSTEIALVVSRGPGQRRTV